jgi:hypothetical protein
LILLGSFLLLGIVVVILISTSYVQTRIVKQLAQRFEETTKQEITFEDLKLRWDGTLQFQNFYLEDHHQDTLFFIKELKTSLLYFQRLKDSIDLDDLSATGVVFNLKKYKGEATHSLKLLLEKFRKDSVQNGNSLFKLASLNLNQLSFFYQDENKPNSKPIRLDPVNINAKNFTFEDNGLEVLIENLEGTMYSPLGRQVKTKGLVHYEPGTLKLEEWHLDSEQSFLIGSLELMGKNKTLKDFYNQGIISLKTTSSNFDFASLFQNSPLQEFPAANSSFNAHGPLKKLNISELVLTNPFLDFKGSVTLKNILEKKNIEWEINTDSLKVNTIDLASLNVIPPQIKKQLQTINEIDFKGTVLGTQEQLMLNIHSDNTWGNLMISGTLGNGIFSSNAKNKNLSLIGDIRGFDLSKWVAKEMGLTTTANVELSGDFIDKESPNLFWKLKNGSLKNPKLMLDGIAIEGRVEERRLRNTFSINSKAVKLKSDILYDFSKAVPQLTLAANVNHWDLNFIGLQLGSGKRIFKGIVLSDLKGNNLDQLEGEIKISSAAIENENQTVTLNPISISQNIVKNKTLLEIKNTDCISGIAEGRFNTSELRGLFQNTFHQVYPFLPRKEVTPAQKVSFKLKVYKKLLDALYPSFSISENIALRGNINSDRQRSQLVLDAPLMRYNDIQFQQLHFQVDTKNPLYNTFLHVENVSHKYYKGKDFNLISTKLRDTLFFRSEFKGPETAKIPFEVNFYHNREVDGTSHFGFKKSIVPIGNGTWTLNPTDGNNQKISYDLQSQESQLIKLTATSGSQSIEVSGDYLNPNAFRLDLEVKKVQLENLLPKIPNFKIAGKSTIAAKIIRSSTENSLDVTAAVGTFKINEEPLGDLNFSINGNTKLNTYFASLDLVVENEQTLTVKGLWQGLEDPVLNFNFNFNAMDIAFLSPLGKKAINNILGKVGGEVALWGPLNEINHEGSLEWREGGFGIPFLNLNYQLLPTVVNLSNQSFIFKSSEMEDIAEGTTAVLNGSFSHSNFTNWFTDLEISSERMLLLNTSLEPESLFFGQGFLDGLVKLEGPTKNLKISLQGTTEEGTSIKIPWSEDYGLTDTSFVSFINKNNRNRFENEDEKKTLKDIKGVELDFELDVNNKATVEIVIDQETGSYLNGRGAGNLLMEINTNGKFNMWGDFITFDGIYNFKNLGVIDKKFNVKPGGTIVWEGDPIGAQMDLEAVYDVPGGANPALLLDNPNFNKNIPTEVLIRLQGNLLKPDDPIFEIGFPNTSGTVASEINYRLADPQRSQLQAISLLSQGIFINEVSVSMQGITNNLYQKASDIVSNLISEENDKLKIGIDYLQGDKSALLDIATEDRLGFTLSTQISEKILLNGKIGVPVGGLEQTLIVGNVQIDFILNEEGSLRAKVFNKENEFRYIGDELGYTQGVGLSYNVDFNTFKELIQKITTTKNFDTEEFIGGGENKNKEMIKFINKN